MAQKKQVLLIAYLFPPIGGGGVQRAVKMARYLGEFGWKVHVLTVDPVYHATLDESLLAEIPDDVVIHRCPEDEGWLNRLRLKQQLAITGGSGGDAKDASRTAEGADVKPRAGRSASLKSGLIKMMKKVKNAVLIPDDQILWYPAAKKKGLEIVRTYGIDAIVSTSGPHTNHLIARYLKRKTGLPWIADFRDPWTQNMHRSGIWWRERIEERLERSVHREANITLTVTHSFARNFNEKFGAAIERLEVIHNGYDPADYAELEHLKKDPADADRCVLMYAGIFYQKRNPRLLLRAVKELIDEGDIDRNRIALRFAGVFDYPGYSDNIDAVRELGLTDIVEVVGNLPHKQALAAMKRSDILLLIGDTAPGSGNYIPGKLFEYMAVGKPILALSMPGESTRIIEKYHLGEAADPLSLDEVKRAFLKLYRDWEKRRNAEAESSGPQAEGEIMTDERPPALERQPSGENGHADKHREQPGAPRPSSTLIYQRREQARRLAELLNEITGSRR